MRGGAAPGHQRWSGSAGTTPRSLSTGSSPRGSERSSDDGEELVEVTLDLQEDDTIILRSVEPAAAGAATGLPLGARGDHAGGASSSSRSRSPSIRRTSSHRLLQFSQELKAEAMSIARQFSQDLTKRFGRTQSRAEGQGHQQQQPSSGIESALAARAARRQRAQLDRTRSGAHKALRGLRFISSNKASNAWMEVQANFDRLACDGFLSRSDFAECIGTTTPRCLPSTFSPHFPSPLNFGSCTCTCRDDGIERVRARAV
jgi:respiratory burst oxidase